MTRFAVLGNCQAASVAKCVRFLVPGSEVDAYILLDDISRAAELQKVAKRLSSYDYILAQPRAAKTISASGASAKRIVHYPSIEFTAFHPDMVYILRTASGTDLILRSPVGDYHSALAFFCYSVGLNYRPDSREIQ